MLILADIGLDTVGKHSTWGVVQAVGDKRVDPRPEPTQYPDFRTVTYQIE